MGLGSRGLRERKGRKMTRSRYGFSQSLCACAQCDADYVREHTGEPLVLCSCGCHTVAEPGDTRCRVSGMSCIDTILATERNGAPCVVRRCTGCSRTVAYLSLCQRCGLCNECCPVVRCGECGIEQNHDEIEFCLICCRCRECCICVRCGDCGELQASLCQTCQRCTDCCICRCRTCHNMISPDTRCRCVSQATHHRNCCPLTAFAFGHTGRRVIPVAANGAGLRFMKGGAKPGDVCRLVGVEIEISSYVYSTSWESYVRKLAVMGCDVVRDGSLPDSGIEIVTAPWSGKLFKKQMMCVLAGLLSHQPKVNDQCGLHVHVDARDFTVYDLRRMIILWSKIESGIASLIPSQRLNGSMCKLMHLENIVHILRLQRSPLFTKRILYGMLYGETAGAQKHKTSKYGEMRYYGLNLHSWNIRKTLEFRFPPGTINYERICFWAALFSQIVQFAFKSKESDLLAMGGEGQYMKNAKKIFDPQTYEAALDITRERN